MKKKILTVLVAFLFLAVAHLYSSFTQMKNYKESAIETCEGRLMSYKYQGGFFGYGKCEIACTNNKQKILSEE
jgi:hypothetical protein